jgi:hypothetical protein
MNLASQRRETIGRFLEQRYDAIVATKQRYLFVSAPNHNVPSLSAPHSLTPGVDRNHSKIYVAFP